MFTHNSPYALLLYKAFSGKIDDFWCLMQPETKKKVSGFVRKNSNKFVAKYRVVFRKKCASATVIVTPFNIRVKSEKRNIVFNDATATSTQVADGISKVLNSL